jgi:hypothetical protein
MLELVVGALEEHEYIYKTPSATRTFFAQKFLGIKLNIRQIIQFLPSIKPNHD